MLSLVPAGHRISTLFSMSVATEVVGLLTLKSEKCIQYGGSRKIYQIHNAVKEYIACLKWKAKLIIYSFKRIK